MTSKPNSNQEKYILTVYEVNPFTPTADGSYSLPGHVFFSVSHGKGADPNSPEFKANIKSFGFSPEEHRHPVGPGKISDDASIYTKSNYTRTIEITKEQHDKLLEFGQHPDKHGFDMKYNVRWGASNHCVDFAVKALDHAGIEHLHKETIRTNGPHGMKEEHVKYPTHGKGLNYTPWAAKNVFENIVPPVPDSLLNSPIKNNKGSEIQPSITGFNTAENNPIGKDGSALAALKNLANKLDGNPKAEQTSAEAELCNAHGVKEGVQDAVVAFNNQTGKQNMDDPAQTQGGKTIV
jgi:hypothetical protein